MSPRPRKATDEEVFAATARVMSKVGPNQLTLAEIASEAGLTPGALVQRFGSKRALLVAVASHVAVHTEDFFVRLRAEYESPLAAIHAYAECSARLADSPAAVTRNFAYLQLDLSDPDLHGQIVCQAKATREGLEGLVDAAVAAGELVATVDSRKLARAIEVALAGSLMAWAVYREGPAQRWMQHDLDFALQPYLA